MKEFLLNTNSKCIHLSNSKDGRCRISTMREEHKVYFDTLKEAKKYPTAENPLAKRCCSFCIANESIYKNKESTKNEKP